jgi:hypothetical protein
VATRGGLSGLALAEIAAGAVLAWSGIANASVAASLRSLLSGHKPQPDTGSQPITAPAGTGGSADTGGASVKGGTKLVSPAQAYQALRGAGLGTGTAVILTAVGGAESGWNVLAVNDNAATGDYSIGVWQVNYYGSLLQSRTAQFGPPSGLIGNLPAQAAAAAAIYQEQGLAAWTTYSSGAFTGYLLQAQSAAQGGT